MNILEFQKNRERCEKINGNDHFTSFICFSSKASPLYFSDPLTSIVGTPPTCLRLPLEPLSLEDFKQFKSSCNAMSVAFVNSLWVLWGQGRKVGHSVEGHEVHFRCLKEANIKIHVAHAWDNLSNPTIQSNAKQCKTKQSNAKQCTKQY